MEAQEPEVQLGAIKKEYMAQEIPTLVASSANVMEEQSTSLQTLDPLETLDTEPPTKKMRLDDDILKRLIEEVKKRPCIYQTRRGRQRVSEKNKETLTGQQREDEKREAFKEIAFVLGLSVPYCERNWRNQRETFGRELKRMREGIRTEPNFKFFEELCFLEKYIQSKRYSLPKSVQHVEQEVSGSKSLNSSLPISSYSGSGTNSALPKSNNSSRRPSPLKKSRKCTPLRASNTSSSTTHKPLDVSLLVKIACSEKLPSCDPQSSATLQSTFCGNAVDSEAVRAPQQVAIETVTIDEENTSMPLDLSSVVTSDSLLPPTPSGGRPLQSSQKDTTSTNSEDLRSTGDISLTPHLKLTATASSNSQHPFSNLPSAITLTPFTSVSKQAVCSTSNSVDCMPSTATSTSPSHIFHSNLPLVTTEQSWQWQPNIIDVRSLHPTKESSVVEPEPITKASQDKPPRRESSNSKSCNSLPATQTVDQHPIKASLLTTTSTSSYAHIHQSSLSSPVWLRQLSKSAVQSDTVSNSSTPALEIDENPHLTDNFCSSCGHPEKVSNRTVGTMTDEQGPDDADGRRHVKRIGVNIFKLAKENLPLYVLEMLTAAGFATIEMIGNMTENEVTMMEGFVRDSGIMAKLVPKNEQDLYFHWYKEKDYKLLPGHRLLLLRLIETLKVCQG